MNSQPDTCFFGHWYYFLQKQHQILAKLCGVNISVTVQFFLKVSMVYDPRSRNPAMILRDKPVQGICAGIFGPLPRPFHQLRREGRRRTGPFQYMYVKCSHLRHINPEPPSRPPRDRPDRCGSSLARA
jgi:hypothetical protein